MLKNNADTDVWKRFLKDLINNRKRGPTCFVCGSLLESGGLARRGYDCVKDFFNVGLWIQIPKPSTCRFPFLEKELRTMSHSSKLTKKCNSHICDVQITSSDISDSVITSSRSSVA